MSNKSLTKPAKNSPLLPLPGALQRLTQVEKDAKRLNASLNDVAHILSANKPVLDAIVEILGTENVLNMARTLHVRTLRAQNEARMASMQKLIDSGAFVKVDEATADSVLLTEEVDAQGIVMEPGRTYDNIPAFPPEIAAQLIGAKVGATIDTTDGQKLTVLEIYNFNPGEPATTPSGPEAPVEEPKGEEG